MPIYNKKTSYYLNWTLTERFFSIWIQTMTDNVKDKSEPLTLIGTISNMLGVKLDSASALQSIKDFIPAEIVIINTTVENILGGFDRDPEQCSHHEFVGCLVAFLVILAAGITLSEYRRGFRYPTATAVYFILKVATVAVWLLCTQPLYLACFVADDKQSNGHSSDVGSETYDTLEFIAGSLLTSWALIIFCVETGIRAQTSGKDTSIRTYNVIPFKIPYFWEAKTSEPPPDATTIERMDSEANPLSSGSVNITVEK
jgi:hypothetical protein